MVLTWWLLIAVIIVVPLTCQSNSTLKRHFVKSLCFPAPVLLFIQANMHLKQHFTSFVPAFAYAILTYRGRTDITSYMETWSGRYFWHSKTFKLHKYKIMAVSKVRILDILDMFESLNCYFLNGFYHAICEKFNLNCWLHTWLWFYSNFRVQML